jgi:hypothetical protein
VKRSASSANGLQRKEYSAHFHFPSEYAFDFWPVEDIEFVQPP